MSLTAFITSLLAEGLGAVPEPGEISAEERAETTEVLEEFERQWRLNVPGEPPPFYAEAAVWAAVRFYQASQYSVFRDEGPEFAFEPLNLASELGKLPSAHYSVDLIFRFLPDLVRHVRAAASADPLVDELLSWGRQWPLSSVGIAGVEVEAASVDLAAVLSSPGLLQMYVDRIIDRRDNSRIGHHAVRQALAAAIGLHPELAPDLVATLKSPEEVSK
jgi:hypothetical protein